MKVKNYYFIIFCLIVLSCNTTNNNPDCSTTSIVVNVISTNSSNSSATGTITVTSPISSEYTYKINSGTYQVNPSFINLAAGTYIITAKNAAGCTGATSVTISNFDCSSTFISVTGIISPANASNGSITITNPIGSNYSYSLNGSSFQTNPTFNTLAAGTYTVIAKNENGCTGSNVFEITGCNSSNMNGVDTGYHSVYIGSIKAPFNDLRDSLIVSHSGNNVDIVSQQLGRVISGMISASNCNSIALDSMIFSNGDTVRIQSSALGIIKMWNIRAGGTATITSNGLNTIINIAKGNTNIVSPINLSNLAGLNMNFRGTFIKR